MTLEELLKSRHIPTRLSIGMYRWLEWDCKLWVASERRVGLHFSEVLYRGDSLEAAIEALVKEA